MFCNHCGAQAPDGSAFCNTCGKSLAEAVVMTREKEREQAKKAEVFEAKSSIESTPATPVFLPIAPPARPSTPAVQSSFFDDEFSKPIVISFSFLALCLIAFLFSLIEIIGVALFTLMVLYVMAMIYSALAGSAAPEILRDLGRWSNTRKAYVVPAVLAIGIGSSIGLMRHDGTVTPTTKVAVSKPVQVPSIVPIASTPSDPLSTVEAKQDDSRAEGIAQQLQSVLQQKKFSEAAALYVQLVDINAGHTKVVAFNEQIRTPLIAQVRALVQAEKWEEAKRVYNDVVKVAPKSEEVMALGTAFDIHEAQAMEKKALMENYNALQRSLGAVRADVKSKNWLSLGATTGESFSILARIESQMPGGMSILPADFSPVGTRKELSSITARYKSQIQKVQAKQAEQNRKDEAERQEREEEAKLGIQEKITASSLFQEYKANEVKADMDYKGKIIQVSGNIRQVRKDFFNNIIIALKGDAYFGDVDCQLVDEQERLASNLQSGDNVGVFGKCTGTVMMSPQLSDCKLKWIPKIRAP